MIRKFPFLIRALSMVLVICLMLSVCPLITIRAHAAGIVYDEYDTAYLLLKNMKDGNSSTGVHAFKTLDLDLVIELVFMDFPHQFSLYYDANHKNGEETSFQIRWAENAEWEAATKKRVKEVVAEIIKPDMTDRDKAKALHDWLVINCSYDKKAATENVTGKDAAPYTAYGALVNGKATCAGYVNAYTRLLREVGIPVYRIDGHSTDADNQGNAGLHAWNYVYLEGAWWYVDVTWDDMDVGLPLTHYFLVDDKVINKKHAAPMDNYIRFLSFIAPERRDRAEYLKEWGLFKGIQNGNFDLMVRPDRAQGAVMMARLLGFDDADPYEVTHPFSDVPAWASGAVSYLYELKLAQGTSAKQFSSAKKMTVNEYVTLVLRAMDYKDGVDFTWSQASELGKTLGIVDDDLLAALRIRPFLRADIVNITYSAMEAKCADGFTLEERLLGINNYNDSSGEAV